MSREYIKAMLIRALHTFIQTMLAAIGTVGTVSSVDWVMVLDMCVMAALLSMLKSILVGLPEADFE